MTPGARSASSSAATRPRPSKLDILSQSTLQAGTLVAGRYRIDAVLGVGGMGAVYEATQININRKVALKIVRPDLAGDPMMAMRFEREARAASAVHHPNVVVVHEFGQADDGTLFLVMELLGGESLSTRTKREGRLPAREAARIAHEVVAALEAAHAAGVVHRDLKPDNIFLVNTGGVKVLDFGIARILDRNDGSGEAQGTDSSALTEMGQMLGTPRYMSPEAVARMPIGPPADLYSLGCILFEMITGRYVFLENQPVLLMSAHLKETPPRLSEVARDLDSPPALEALVDDLLKKLPTDRPGSASSVKRRLMVMDWTAPSIAETFAAESRFEKPPDEDIPVEQYARGTGRAVRVVRSFLVLALAAAIAWLLYEHRQRLEAERREEASNVVVRAIDEEEVPRERVPEVLMTISIAPPAAVEHAVITWDGAEQTGSFSVPADGVPHRLEVRAEGYETYGVEIPADGPHTIAVELHAARARRRGGR
jgi:serine/threonine-protein kinase